MTYLRSFLIKKGFSISILVYFGNTPLKYGLKTERMLTVPLATMIPRTVTYLLVEIEYQKANEVRAARINNSQYDLMSSSKAAEHYMRLSYILATHAVTSDLNSAVLSLCTWVRQTYRKHRAVAVKVLQQMFHKQSIIFEEAITSYIANLGRLDRMV
ncbi:hypothetical protein BO82DRAFT_368937 [Aspergillus uvarum CBS 121591]|uniref:Uncharacterized protein n=1 Tax=Aspergillus uvarum CBS 121591 TaxID=1448315 RepID=A0A319BTH8_9EURO|nr:hypothetical protein BO82DRAFT_368937 [Aspergillus uvarum CBS 121591]PYH76946.1 hypothetical protein BO82DRAFT_368937 [Aspergillus uvarum CBS 121591]